ncbi:MAG: hypothetical protein J5I81_11855 [Nitrococcus mobilis]|nr:hypothetical protein [Nitrococcus mobilis]
MVFPEFLKRSIISAILLTAMVSSASILAGQDRPLKVRLEIHEQVGFSPDCPSQFGGTTTGTGKGTHLGRLSFNATDCITPMEDHFTFTGEFTIVVADGDKLTGNYSGSFITINTGPVYSLSDAMLEITGGTGRFAQATGSAKLTGTENVTTGNGTFNADGTISY